jgi:hypothetical protein
MHYTGMMAYRVQGIVSREMPYLMASIVLSVGLSAAGIHFAMRSGKVASTIMAGTLALALLILHFTGMTALPVEPLLIDGSFSNPEALRALALAVAGMALVIVGAGLVSYLIDDSTRAESVERLRLVALSDTLTGLPNRASFNERFAKILRIAPRRRIASVP